MALFWHSTPASRWSSKGELPYRTFAETAVPLHVVCAELVTGEAVVISSGDMAEAIIASTAIPGVFPPVERQGRYLVDVIVLPCGFACTLNTVSKRAIGRAIHAITLLGARELRRDYEHYSNSVVMRFAPPICPLSQSPYNYSNGADLIAKARNVTRAWIDGGGLDCGDFPNQLATHTHA